MFSSQRLNWLLLRFADALRGIRITTRIPGTRKTRAPALPCRRVATEPSSVPIRRAQNIPSPAAMNRAPNPEMPVWARERSITCSAGESETSFTGKLIASLGSATICTQHFFPHVRRGKRRTTHRTQTSVTGQAGGLFQCLGVCRAIFDGISRPPSGEAPASPLPEYVSGAFPACASNLMRRALPSSVCCPSNCPDPFRTVARQYLFVCLSGRMVLVIQNGIEAMGEAPHNFWRRAPITSVSARPCLTFGASLGGPETQTHPHIYKLQARSSR